MPSIAGSLGSDSEPAADTSSRALVLPAEVSIRHRAAAASQLAEQKVTPNRNRSSTPDPAATRRRYCWISGCGEKERDQSGFSAKENEYSWDGTSQVAPG